MAGTSILNFRKPAECVRQSAHELGPAPELLRSEHNNDPPPSARDRIKPLAVAVLAAAALALGALSAVAPNYRLRAGDVSVADLPQFGQRAPVQLDGTITILPIGSLAVEPQQLSSVRPSLLRGGLDFRQPCGRCQL